MILLWVRLGEVPAKGEKKLNIKKKSHSMIRKPRSFVFSTNFHSMVSVPWISSESICEVSFKLHILFQL